MLETKTPHAVDVHVGQRIRLARRTKGMSQQALADASGVTFQQCQKYENGANRVSASRLWEIAKALGHPVGYFYDGLPEDPDQEPENERRLREFAQTPLGQSILDAASALPGAVVLGHVAAMIEARRAIENPRKPTPEEIQAWVRENNARFEKPRSRASA